LRMRARSLDERVDARADGAFGRTLSSRGSTGAVDVVVAEDEEVEVGTTGDGRPSRVDAAGDVRRTRLDERSPASLHLLDESRLTAGEADAGGAEESVDVVLMRSLEGGEAVRPVVVADSEVELALVDGLASSGDVDGGLLVGAGPAGMRGQRKPRRNGERESAPAEVGSHISEGEAGGVVSRVQRRVVEAGTDDGSGALRVGVADEAVE
jgi:hypothetical protein